MNRALLIAVIAGSAGLACAEGAQPQPGEGGPAPRADVRPTVRARDCTTSGCHAQQTSHTFLHGPAAVSACDACHTYADVSAHTFKLRAQGRDLCTFCHINKAGNEAPVSHKPYTDGECLKCHDPHGGATRKNLRHADLNTLCLSCHETVLAGHSSIHEAITDKNCTGCHQAHTAEHAKLLVKPGKALCLSCHEQVQHQIDGAKSAHEPLLRDGECTQCHTPHASNTSHQLKAPPAQLCSECHKEVAQQAREASHPHSAVLEGEACLNCHNPHGSAHAKLMKGDPVATCVACHKEPEAAAELDKPVHPAAPYFVDQSPVKIVNVPAAKQARPASNLTTKGLNPHGPVAEGRCTACHDVHGGSHAGLLRAKLSTEFYQAFNAENFALCFTCHEQGLAVAEKTADATNFRDGERNLHYLHVAKDQGRGCTACHTVHASRHEQQIRDTVPYGGWQLPLNFKPLESGGSCAPGCHKPQTYTREAVEIRAKEPPPPPPPPKPSTPAAQP